MYECPASIAPEPNNYISSRSVFFPLVSRTEDSFQPCQRISRWHSPTWEKFGYAKEKQKPIRTWFSMFVWPQWLLYLFTAAFAERLPSLCSSLCVNPAQKRKADGSPPLPDDRWQATKTESSLSQWGAEKIQAPLKRTNQRRRGAGQTPGCKYN